jgi:DNA-binding FadR family transcriptional regulator
MPRLIAADIARNLKRRIDAGEWADGSPVPAERDLATEFGVARNTMRRAMNILRDGGAISRHVGRGTFVNMTPNPTMMQIIAKMEGASPADMMELRLLLEPLAASNAAIHASSAQLAAIEEAHGEATNATDIMTFERWDAALHHRIFSCSRNELLRGIYDLLHVLRNQSPWFDMKKRSFSEERRQIYCRQHGAIVAAMLRRDPEAAHAAMVSHLKTVEANMLGR